MGKFFIRYSNKYIMVFGVFLIIIAVSFIAYLIIHPKLITKNMVNNSTNATESIANKPLLIPLANYSSNLQQGPYTCPVTVIYCKDNTNYKLETFSAQIPKKSPIYAAFDGNILIFNYTNTLPNGKNENFINVLLQNDEKGLIAKYFFKGDVNTENGKVTAGSQIGTSSGEPVTFMNNKSFTFDLSKVTSTNYEAVNLSPGDFK